MSYDSSPEEQQQTDQGETRKSDLSFLLNILLFLLTFFTTTVAGVQWVGKDAFELTNLKFGLPYSFSILFVTWSPRIRPFFRRPFAWRKSNSPILSPFPSNSDLLELRDTRGTYSHKINGPQPKGDV